jgi:FMN-dependent NADH-azoreductase
MGLAGGKCEVIAASRGGIRSANETRQALDHLETYLRTVSKFPRPFSIARAEGLQLSEETAAKAFTLARAAIGRLTRRAAA